MQETMLPNHTSLKLHHSEHQKRWQQFDRGCLAALLKTISDATSKIQGTIELRMIIMSLRGIHI